MKGFLYRTFYNFHCIHYNSVQLSFNSLQQSTTLPRTDTTSVRGSFFFEDFSEKIDRNEAESNLMDFGKRIIGPEVEGSTQQTLTTQKTEDEREGIPMKRNRDFWENDSYLVFGVDTFCRDDRMSMESNWSDDYSWDNREAVENFMSRHGCRVESLIHAY